MTPTLRLWSASAGLVRITLRSLFAGKRAAAAAFLFLLPVLLAFVLARNGREGDALRVYQGVVFQFSLWFMIYLLALIFGLALSSGEIEDGTAGYLYLGALPRWLVVLLQGGVTAAALSVVLLGSLLLTGLAAGAGRGGVPDLWRHSAFCTLAGSAALTVALAYTITCGLVFRSPLGALAAAVIPVFFWEILVTLLPIRFAAWTVTNNVRGLLLSLLFDGRRVQPFFTYVQSYSLPSYGEAAFFLSALSGLFLATAMVAAMNRSIEGKEAR